MGTARSVALDALVACEKQGAWSDGYLKKAIKAAELDGRDAALATRLCFGVLQNRMLLDFYLSQMCTTRLEKLEAPIRNLLRLGAYQILYLDRVPDHAAVSETVSLARKKAKNPRAAGLVNGVLRSLVRQKDSLPEPPDPATRYSHPQWLAVTAADPRPGMRVLDACAAPGGKSFAAAIAMGDRGEVVSCDIHPHKEKLIQAGAARLGLTCIQTEVLDGKSCKEKFLDSFDLVIADVPCSGLGIIRKKPDIRYKDPKPLENLPQVQAAILDNVSRYVSPGGVLLYATCTLLERENEGVVRAFLDRCKDFTPERFQLPGGFEDAETGMVTCWPHRHDTDGFFFAKLRRTKDGDI